MTKQKRTTKKKAGGGDRDASSTGPLDIHSEPQKNLALSAYQIADQQYLRWLTGEDKKERAAEIEALERESKALHEEYEKLSERLVWLEHVAGMTLKKRTARMSEIASPSQRLKVATKRVNEVHATDRRRFENASPAEGIKFPVTLDQKIERQKLRRRSLIRSEIGRIKREYESLKKYDGKDRKALYKAVTETKKKLVEVEGRLSGAPHELHIATMRVEFAMTLADQVAEEIASELANATTQEKERADLIHVVSQALMPVGWNLRWWLDFPKLLCALRALRCMAKKPDETRRKDSVELLLREWVGLQDVVMKRERELRSEGNLQWEERQQPIVERARIEFLWRLPDHYSREAMEELDRKHEEMHAIGTLVAQGKTWNEIAEMIERENIKRRIMTNVREEHFKRSVADKDGEENIKAMLASGDFKRRVDNAWKNSPVTGITIRDRYLAYCKKHGIKISHSLATRAKRALKA